MIKPSGGKVNENQRGPAARIRKGRPCGRPYDIRVKFYQGREAP